jgi:hypothetical protein
MTTKNKKILKIKIISSKIETNVLRKKKKNGDLKMIISYIKI